jgi:hypothetical protein
MKEKFGTVFALVIAAALISMYFAGGHQVLAQNITDTQDDDCFHSNADFCGGAAYIPNPNKNNNKEHDKFPNGADFKCYSDYCIDVHGKKYYDKENNNDNHKTSSSSDNNHKATIKVSYGDVGSYNGKGKVVIKNNDTGKTLVVHKLNFAKQHANQGDKCCVKTYTFDSSGTHFGDKLTIKVTGGGGSWEDLGNYTKHTHLYVTLDEIGE